MQHTWHKVTAGWYRTDDGHSIIRRDPESALWIITRWGNERTAVRTLAEGKTWVADELQRIADETDQITPDDLIVGPMPSGRPAVRSSGDKRKAKRRANRAARFGRKGGRR